jgi:hypothetical protein
MAGLVVWEPVVDPAQYVHQLLRVNVSTQMVALGRIERDRSDLIADARRGGVISVNGFGLSGPFIDALFALDLDSKIGQLSIPTLWLSTVSADQTVTSNPSVVAKRVSTFRSGRSRNPISQHLRHFSRKPWSGWLRIGTAEVDEVSRPVHETVSFPCEGFQLRGSLHRAAGSADGDTAIVILNQGPLDRSGAHRMSVRYARRWAASRISCAPIRRARCRRQ